jgi:hypothetical protein
MDKKKYSKPNMMIVLFRHRASLLAGTNQDPTGSGNDGGPVNS